jgi:hypothetical protein
MYLKAAQPSVNKGRDLFGPPYENCNNTKYKLESAVAYWAKPH